MLPEAFSFIKLVSLLRQAVRMLAGEKLGVDFSLKKQSGDFVEKWSSSVRKGIWFLEVHMESSGPMGFFSATSRF